MCRRCRWIVTVWFLALFISAQTARTQDLRPSPFNPNDLFQQDLETALGLTDIARVYGGDPEAPFILRATGRAVVDAIYDTSFVGSNALLFPSTVALDGTKEDRQGGRFLMDASKATLAFDLQAPAMNGAQAYVEMDFLDFESRLRHAYGQFDAGSDAKVSGGLVWTTFVDAKHLPLSIVNDGTPAGAIFRRQVQLRYTRFMERGFSSAMAIENPTNTDFTLPDPANDARLQRYPDLVTHIRWQDEENPYRNAQLAALVRGLGYEDLGEDEHFTTGWGLSLSSRWPVFDDNNVRCGVTWGEGVGRYLFGFGAEADQAAAVPGAGGELHALENVGAYAGYQHFWSPWLMSNVAYGFAEADTTATIPATATESTQNAWTNVIVLLNDNIAVGLEYHFAMREARSGVEGDNHRIQMTLSVMPKKKEAAPAAAYGFVAEPSTRYGLRDQL